MAASKTGPKAPKIIDVEQLERCAEKHWSTEEIAAFFKCSRDTIERRFAANIKESRHRGTARIRDLQWKRALEGSDKMIVHMSSHYLGQNTKSDIRLTEEPKFQTKEEAIQALEDTIKKLKNEN